MGKHWSSSRSYVGLIACLLSFMSTVLYAEVINKVETEIKYDNLDKIYLCVVLNPELKNAFINSIKKKYNSKVDIVLVDIMEKPFQGLDVSHIHFFISLIDKGKFFELNLEASSLATSLYNDSIFNAIIWQNCQITKDKPENIDPIMDAFDVFVQSYLSGQTGKPTFYIPVVTR